MPRPRKIPGQLAPKNGIRKSKYSIVIHDIQVKDAKSILRQHILNNYKPEWFLIGEEEYNHQDGTHIHIFLEYRSKPQAYSTLQASYEGLKLGRKVVITWGKGSFEQCERYLQGHTKDKYIDGELFCEVSLDEYKRMLQEYSDSVPLFERVNGRLRANTFIDIPDRLKGYGRQHAIIVQAPDVPWSDFWRRLKPQEEKFSLPIVQSHASHVSP